ncbi:MAG: hypothetical protein JWM95_3176 [Gemmatimonadetes bacterium]|nr:hypothetical protein [Gemmatimonadota bacterium]
MKRTFALILGAVALGASAGQAQQAITVVDLPPATAKSAFTFGAVLGIREVSGGKVLVNDAVRHQMKLLDSSLALVNTPLDSVPGLASSYGARPLPLVRYLGDSSLTSDVEAGTLLMLGPGGQVARAVASPYVQSVPPYANLTGMMRLNATGVDDRGRILFQGYVPLTKPDMTVAERVAALSRDTVLILRADFESRRVDTVARIRNAGTTALMGRASEGGPVRFSSMPVSIVDVWAVLSDGTVGIVRGQDYHVDWISPDGTTHSTSKLPFDWKRLTDEDKRRLIDSVRADQVPRLGAAMAQSQPRPQGSDADAGGATAGARTSVPREQGPPRPPMAVEYVPPALKDIPDYYPSVRMGAAMADRDGNLWILPNSSAQSRQGELVYDVINPQGSFRRVRLPVSRSIAGFGKDGVVYLLAGNRSIGFNMERTRLPRQ